MQETIRRIDTPEVAKLIRKALKAKFPGQKFSVRSSRYAGGCSVDVRWTDGPTVPAVDAVIGLYQGASFDGMTDMKSYHESMLSTEDGAEVVRFSADFVHSHREMSDEWKAELIREIEDFTGRPFDYQTRYPVSGPRREDDEMAHDPHGGGEYGSTLLHQLAYYRTR